MHIVTVSSKSDRHAFVNFPRALYDGNPFWVPPLWQEEKHSYEGSRNVMLRDNEHVLLLVKDQKTILGRLLVYIDNTFNTYYTSKIGFFGAFECTDRQDAADLLLSAACQWLRDRGMDTIRGPFHPVAESWGFLLEGYDSLPVLMAPYNPPYYHKLMERRGLSKVKDLLAYEVDIDREYSLPPRIGRFTKLLVSRRPQFSVRTISIDNLMADAGHIWRISNISIADNWGYVPVDIAVMRDMVRRLRTILDPDAVWFVEDNGVPVGYALGFPDPNPTIQDIKGRLFPFGFLKLLKVAKHSRRYRLFALGVLPKYHGMGLDVLLYKSLHTALSGRGILLEANYILEDNYKIRNALEKLGLRLTKKYRMYEMPL
jgi:GNAT superfamily N-acetyltransferase